jgi:hypothetical protein
MVEGCGTLTKEEKMAKRLVPVTTRPGARDVGGKKFPLDTIYHARPAHLGRSDGNVALYADPDGRGEPVTHVAARHVIQQ